MRRAFVLGVVALFIAGCGRDPEPEVFSAPEIVRVTAVAGADYSEVKVTCRVSKMEGVRSFGVQTGEENPVRTEGSMLGDNEFFVVLTGLLPETEYSYRAYLDCGSRLILSETHSWMTGKIEVKSLKLSQNTLWLTKGGSATLTATVVPEMDVFWSSTSTDVATVDQNGTVTAVGAGKATISATCAGVSATCLVTVAGGASTPEGAVDLGFSVKWATCNLGEDGFVSTPEEKGAYFAWGETEPKDEYNWETYKWCEGTQTTLTKYNTDSEGGIVDNRTVLETGPDGDDAASKILGGSWRMPTKEEMEELVDATTAKMTRQNEVRGFIFTAENGKGIFIPFNGIMIGTGLDDIFGGHYWTSSLYPESFNNHKSVGAYHLQFRSGGTDIVVVVSYETKRSVGMGIRPVWAE